MRRRQLAFIVGFLLLALACIGWRTWLNHSSSRLPVDTSEVAYRLLHAGMTEAEVEKVIGGPAGNYATGRYLDACFFVSGNGDDLGLRASDECEKKWITDLGEIIVRFDKCGRTYHLRHGVGFVRESLDDKIYRYLNNVLPLPESGRNDIVPRTVP